MRLIEVARDQGLRELQCDPSVRSLVRFHGADLLVCALRELRQRNATFTLALQCAA
jgi:hypothetical protein